MQYSNLIRNSILIFFFFLISIVGFSKYDIHSGEDDFNTLYETLSLDTVGLSKEAFNNAIEGWKKLMAENKITNPSILSIADLTQSSCLKRFYIIDLQQKKLLFNTYVAHGKNSGDEYATSFSNIPDSYQSSLGFYVTGEAYKGAHGLSMKLRGMEKGINDVAEARNIVLHGAAYVDESFIQQYGRLGRSFGCPAVPTNVCAPIIEALKNGTCLFIYNTDKNYLRRSELL